MTLSAMIFASAGEMRSRIQRRCINSGDMTLFRSPEYRPSGPDIVRLINSYNPELVIIEFHDRQEALEIEATVRAACPAVGIVGVADQWAGDRVLSASGGTLRVLPSTIAPDEFSQQVAGTMDLATAMRDENVIVFLPAKAGSGASSLALNVSNALANRCGKSTILIEADLHSGPAGMYLGLDPRHSVVDALQESHRLEAVWNDLITPFQNFAILPAAGIRGAVPQPSAWAYRRLLTFTRLRYEHVVFDLPEVVNPATDAVVSSARIVFVVCTPELPSLMLAKKRCAGLIDRGVPSERIQIVLNRFAKSGPDPAAVGEIIGHPVSHLIPNDYKTLFEANLKRCLVSPQSAVGRACESFARSLGGGTDMPKAVRKFFGLFSAA